MAARRLAGLVPGILDLVSLAVVLALAVPMGLFGAELLLDGHAVGAAYLALAGVLVVGQHVLTTPDDLPTRAVQYVVGAAVRDPDD
jgi:hypothetical protein